MLEIILTQPQIEILRQAKRAKEADDLDGLGIDGGFRTAKELGDEYWALEGGDCEKLAHQILLDIDPSFSMSGTHYRISGRGLSILDSIDSARPTQPTPSTSVAGDPFLFGGLKAAAAHDPGTIDQATSVFDELKKLRAENERLRKQVAERNEVLKPFAAGSEDEEVKILGDDAELLVWCNHQPTQITIVDEDEPVHLSIDRAWIPLQVKHLRAAAKVISKGQSDDPA
jgi:hypothetical protein